MISTNLNHLELTEFTSRTKPRQRCRSTFPLLGFHGTKKSALVYFELAPGDELGTHTDSAEELLLILEGQVEVTVEDETSILEQRQIALVPEMVKHNIVNTGKTIAKVLGFFGGANHIVATFDEVWHPIDSNSVNTSLLQ